MRTEAEVYDDDGPSEEPAMLEVRRVGWTALNSRASCSRASWELLREATEQELEVAAGAPGGVFWLAAGSDEPYVAGWARSLADRLVRLRRG